LAELLEAKGSGAGDGDGGSRWTAVALFFSSLSLSPLFFILFFVFSFFFLLSFFSALYLFSSPLFGLFFLLSSSLRLPGKT
jgi:hypothetical protein